jgi:hypothetical protein
VSVVKDTPLGHEMGMGTTLTIFGTNERAFLDADIDLRADELQRVLMAIRLKGLDVTSIRDHLVGEVPPVVFVRVWETGSAADLATALR